MSTENVYTSRLEHGTLTYKTFTFQLEVARLFSSFYVNFIMIKMIIYIQERFLQLMKSAILEC